MLTLSVSGCVHGGGPKSWTGAPPIAGTLHNHGMPVTNVKVRMVHRLSHDGQLKPDSLTQETNTDKDGKFFLGPLGKKSHAVHVSAFGIGESIADWGIQFLLDGKWQTGWNSSKGIGYAPREQVVADCDTTRTPTDIPDYIEIAGTSYGAKGLGFCQLSLNPTKK